MYEIIEKFKEEQHLYELKMSLSILLYESENNFTEQDISKLREYFDDKTNPTKISKVMETFVEGSSIYHIFRVAKRVNVSIREYTVNEENIIIPTENEELRWETYYVYLKENSKYIYVRGSNAGWIGQMLSETLFTSDDKIKLREIDTAKLEEDIRKNAKFQSTGTSFVDTDGTKITIKNPAGIDLEQHYITKGKTSFIKNHIDILIEKDDLNFDVYVYPDGKVTFSGGYTKNPTTALRIFLKIWSQIKDYA